MNLERQEREIRELLRRAKNTLDTHSKLRQDTLERLIDLAHSEHTSFKIIAAGNICLFLADFPELEEVAIDAIYDLCEDPSSKVRIEGYYAIIQVSKVQSKWVKRNADVLVQLLQSEEVDEVVVVKKALIEHLNMDFRVTFGVLCDQIIPRDDTADEEEIMIRDRLRSLVLEFMASEAKRTICERHCGEAILYEGLFAAIPKLAMDDLQLTIKELIYALPAFKNQQINVRGSELLQILLENVGSVLKRDLNSAPRAVSLTNTRPLLEICEHITSVLQVAPAVVLLEFYCSSSLIGKITLHNMTISEQQWVVSSLATVLEAAEKQGSSRIESLRRRIVDASPYLIEILKQTQMSEPRFMKSYKIFLRTYLERKTGQDKIPPYLFIAIQQINTLPDVARDEECQKIIRSLTSPGQPLLSQEIVQAGTVPSAPLLSTPNASVPSSRPASSQTSKGNHTHDQIAMQNQDGNKSRRDDNLESSSRPVKRSKVDNEIVQKGPSLLSRLGNSLSRQSSYSEPNSRAQSSSPKPEDETPNTKRGISIKGAAAKQAKATNTSNSRPPSSLLDRLQDPRSGEPPTRPDQHEAGRKRRQY